MKPVIYLLQVTACTGIFYAFYFLLLRRYTFFTLNRWYLLGTVLLSFIIPAITIPVKQVPQVPVMQPVIYMQQMQTLAKPVYTSITYNPDDGPAIDYLRIIQTGKFVYSILSAILLIRLIYVLVLFAYRTRSQKLMQIGRVHVLKSSGSFSNSSFFNVIFINDDELSPDEVKQILTHELLHVKLLHSADRLIARLAQIVLWFNPFVYAYTRAIEENHEFEVDCLAAGDNDKSGYATLLFKLSVSNQSSLFQSFSKAPLKRRVAMLFNQPTNHMKKVMYLLALPVIVLSCLAFGKLKGTGLQGKKLSAIDGLEQLGSHPLVIIDDKLYNDNILYNISHTCVAATSISWPSEHNKRYGEKAKDGVVVIKTRQHKIIYLSATERENLEKIAKLPANQFYARIRLKNNDGTEFEKAIIRMPEGKGSASSDMKNSSKVVFIVNGKAFPEQQAQQVEAFVKSHKMLSWGTGDINKNTTLTTEDLSRYDVYFELQTDTSDMKKYRQIDRLRGKKGAATIPHKPTVDYRLTTDFKQKQAASEKVAHQILKFKVLSAIDSTYGFNNPFGHVKGFQLLYSNQTYVLNTNSPRNASMNNQLQAGDEIEIKVRSVLYGPGIPIVLEPEYVVKNGSKIFQLAQADTARNYAFLYEANRVRFTDGKITNIQKYANGKIKSAVVEVDNGYKIKFNAKASASQFAGISEGDHVWFRFVHEVQTGAKEYTVNDWVALSNHIKSYGIKNPEFFYKFYEKI